MPDYKMLTKKEYKNGLITYLKITRQGISELPYINKKQIKQNRRSIHTTLWNSQDDIKQFVTIKPAPLYRCNLYSQQNKMICKLMHDIKMPKYAFVNELNDKNPDSAVYGTYHTHALVSEYRSKSEWETVFGKGFVSVDEVNHTGKQINYVLKYVLKSGLPKYARLICVGYDKVKISRVKQISEKVVDMKIDYHRHTFTTLRGDAPY